MTEAWTTARRTRQAVQTRLTGERPMQLLTPKSNARVPLMEVSKNRHDSPLTAYGFKKTNAPMKRKRPLSHLQVEEVRDSQADSDDENVMPRFGSDSAHSLEGQESPIKRRKTVYTTFTEARQFHALVPKASTPIVSRFIEHGSSSPVLEIPSSVSWERDAYAPWCEESPVKVHKYKLLPLSVGICSPPHSSPSMREAVTMETTSCGQEHYLHTTPAGLNKYMHTPPPTVEGVKLFQEYQQPALDIHNDAQSDLEQDAGHGDQQSAARYRRRPLVELDPSLILAPTSRQHALTPPTTTEKPRYGRETTAQSRDESPTEWYDALESLNHSSQMDAARMEEQVLPPMVNQHSTIEDSQFDEAFAPFSSDPLPDHESLPNHASSDASDRSDWQVANSLGHTLLPPNYRASQYHSDPADASSQAWLPTTSSSTQDVSSPSHKRSCPTSDEQQGEEEDNVLPRKKLALPSSEPYSFDYDASLANTMLPPPLFSLPCTPEE